jgi:hypothetical protein
MTSVKTKKAPKKKKAKITDQKNKALTKASNKPKVVRELSLEQKIEAHYLDGIAGALFPTHIAQIKSGEELSNKQLKQLSQTLLKCEVGRNLFAFIANQQRAHEKLNMTLEDYAQTFAKCSRDEFNKRVRRAEDEIELFGKSDFIGTLNNAVLDALNSIRVNESRIAMVDTFNALIAKKKEDVSFVITVPEVNSKLLELFPITAHSECKGQKSIKSDSSANETSEDTRKQGVNESAISPSKVKPEVAYSKQVISILDNFIEKATRAELSKRELKAVRKVLKPTNDKIKALLNNFED